MTALNDFTIQTYFHISLEEKNVDKHMGPCSIKVIELNGDVNIIQAIYYISD